MIVSVFEQPLTLRWLLEALSKQDYNGPWEVLIADDGSDPEILTIVKEASWSYDLDVRYIWQPDAGFRVCRSRNNAIRCARGSLLVFVDGDMVVRPNFLSVHAAAHRNAGRLLLCGTRERLTVRGDRPPRDATELFEFAASIALIEGLPTEAKQQQAWARSNSQWMAIAGSNFSVPRAGEVVFNEMFVGWGSEDRELACRLTRRHGYKIAVSDGARGLHVGIETPAREPVNRGEHQTMLEIIRNKLLFRHLHPEEDLTPALRMLANCVIDSRTGTWRYDEQPASHSLAEAIAAAEQWMDDHHIEFRPDGRR